MFSFLPSGPQRHIASSMPSLDPKPIWTAAEGVGHAWTTTHARHMERQPKSENASKNARRYMQMYGFLVSSSMYCTGLHTVWHLVVQESKFSLAPECQHPHTAAKVMRAATSTCCRWRLSAVVVAPQKQAGGTHLARQ